MPLDIYVKVKAKASVHERQIRVRDAAEIWCNSPEKKQRAEHLSVFLVPDGSRQKRRYIISAMDILNVIAKEFSGACINLLGEADVVVTYEEKAGKHAWYEYLKILFVCMITFTGAAFAIMTFNNDVDVGMIFRMLYRLFTGEESDGKTILEGTYSLGIFLGIVIFFNHFSRWKIQEDPTPLEVQMQMYEKNVNMAMIQNKEQEDP